MRISLLSIVFVVLSITGCNQYTEELAVAPLSADLDAGKKVFDEHGCGGCHGQDASQSALGVSRIIVNIDKVRDIENALYALKSEDSNRRQIMKDQAASLSTEDILNVAQYIKSLSN